MDNGQIIFHLTVYILNPFKKKLCQEIEEVFLFIFENMSSSTFLIIQ